MSHQRKAIIAFDIRCRRRRYRVNKELANWRLGGQYSLIECLVTQRQADELLANLMSLMDSDEDRLLFAWVNPVSASHDLRRVWV
ncbi:MAG: CRISPR-associated endonuclease Cas2 [Gammaproteobacteria bacterium]